MSVGNKTPQRDELFAALQHPKKPSLVLAAMALLVVAICVAYVPGIQGGFIWDDDAHVTKPELQSLQGLARIWFEVGATQQYYPLLHSAFWIEHQLWGDQSLGYHLINLLWHATAALLVYLILKKLAIPGALLAAAIFALHPVQVESVAWITEQKNTLSAVFYLGALLTYLHFDQARQPSLYALALGLFVLGLLTKTVTATLPAALLVIFWWQRGSLSWQRDVRPLIPFFLLGAIAGLFTAWVERTLIGAEGAPFDLSILQRGLLAGRVIWFYLGNLIWPANLIFIYPRWHIDPALWWQWLFPLASVLLLTALWRLRHRWRGPLAAWLFFVGTLFPVLGFFNVFPFMYSFVADHFQYLASLGMIVLTAAAIALLISRLSPTARWIGHGLCLAMLAILATLTWQQTKMYSDIVTLWQTTLVRNSACWLAYNNLGVQYASAGRFKDALENYRQSLVLKPDYAEAHFNLANAVAREGDQQQAIEHYRQALQIRPNYAEAHNNLGAALLATGQTQEALEQLQRAVELRPNRAKAHRNLGNALLAANQPQLAQQHFEQALRLETDNAESQYNLALILANAGRSQEAIQCYQQALRIQPDNVQAHNNLGILLTDANRTPEAIQHFQQALQLAPENVDTHHNLGVALLSAHRVQDAIQQFKEVLRRQPNRLQTYSSLTEAYAQLQQPAEAIATAQNALDLARSTGQTALAEQIDAWLKNYRAQQPSAPDQSGRSSRGESSP